MTGLSPLPEAPFRRALPLPRRNSRSREGRASSILPPKERLTTVDNAKAAPFPTPMRHELFTLVCKECYIETTDSIGTFEGRSDVDQRAKGKE